MTPAQLPRVMIYRCICSSMVMAQMAACRTPQCPSSEAVVVFQAAAAAAAGETEPIRIRVPMQAQAAIAAEVPGARRVVGVGAATDSEIFRRQCRTY